MTMDVWGIGRQFDRRDSAFCSRCQEEFTFTVEGDTGLTVWDGEDNVPDVHKCPICGRNQYICRPCWEKQKAHDNCLVGDDEENQHAG